MPRGVPLTPEQIERAAEAYARTGSYSEAARAIDASETAVRLRLIARKETERRGLHARALARGLRKGRAALTSSLDDVDQYLRAHAGLHGEVPSIEPRDYAALLNARATAVKTMVDLEARLDSHAQARLTREKTRAETEVLRRKADGTLPPEKHETTLTLDAAVTRIQELVHAARQRASSGGPRVPDAN